VVDAVSFRPGIDLGARAALVALLGTPVYAVAQQPPPQTVRINYVNADLGDVIRSLATDLGVNVMLTDVPPRRITFQAPQPVPVP